MKRKFLRKTLKIILFILLHWGKTNQKYQDLIIKEHFQHVVSHTKKVFQGSLRFDEPCRLQPRPRARVYFLKCSLHIHVGRSLERWRAWEQQNWSASLPRVGYLNLQFADYSPRGPKNPPCISAACDFRAGSNPVRLPGRQRPVSMAPTKTTTMMMTQLFCDITMRGHRACAMQLRCQQDRVAVPAAARSANANASATQA